MLFRPPRPPPPSLTKDKRKDIYNNLMDKKYLPTDDICCRWWYKKCVFFFLSSFLSFVQIPHSGIDMSKKGFKNGGIASRELGGCNEGQRSHVSLDV